MKLHKCYGEKPNLDHVKVLSYVAYTHIPDSNCKKLDKMAQRLRFIGYTKTAIYRSSFKAWDEEKCKFYVCHDAIFNKMILGEHRN